MSLFAWIAAGLVLLGTPPLGAEVPSAAATPPPQVQAPADPHEAINRKLFGFNVWLVDQVVEPSAAWLSAHLHESIQTMGHNMYENLVEPEFIFTNALVGDYRAAGTSSARFVINSTLGLLGAWDAAGWMGLERKEEGFVGSLCVAGMSPGNYVLLPAVGPGTGHTVMLISGFLVVTWYALAMLSPALATADILTDLMASAASLREMRDIPPDGDSDPYQVQRDRYLDYLKANCPPAP